MCVPARAGMCIVRCRRRSAAATAIATGPVVCGDDQLVRLTVGLPALKHAAGCRHVGQMPVVCVTVTIFGGQAAR